MDLDIDELLEAWALHNAPALLCDPELRDRLLDFIHRLLLQAVREERRDTTRRVLRPSRS